MLEKLVVPVLLVLVGAILPTVKAVSLMSENHELILANAQLVVDKATLTASNSELKAGLEEQTAKVSEWEAEAERKKKAAAEALAEANRKAEEWRVKYRKLLSDPPDNPNDQAASLEARMKAYLEARATP